MAYLKNNASPLPVKAKVTNATTGAPITSGVAAYHITGVTRAAGGGTLAHIASGDWNYIPTQAETNYDEFAIEFYHADAVCEGPIVQVLTDAKLVSALNDLAAGAEMDLIDAPNATAVGAIQAGLATPTNITAGTLTTVTTVTNLTNAPTSGDLTATMKASVTAAVPTVAQIWAALTSGLTAAGSIGKWIVDKLDVVLSTRNATAPLDATDTQAAAAAAITAAGLATAADLGAMDDKIDIIQVAAVLSRKLRTGNVRDKSGVPGTIEILDDDGTTVIATIALSETTPYQAVTLA